MNFVKYFNTELKMRKKPHLSENQLRKLESYIIRFVNRYNKIENTFVNNKVVFFFTELRIRIFGSDYPEYLYNPDINSYIAGFNVIYQTKNAVLRRFRLILGLERIEFDGTVVSDYRNALDFSKMSPFKRLWSKRMVNKAWSFNGSGKFDFKRVITYEKPDEEQVEQEICSEGYDMNDGTGEPRE